MDIEDLMAFALRSGWTREKAGTGHWKLISPCGTKTIVCAASSVSRRGALNMASLLRRAGLQVPHRGGRR